ncbi:MAG: SOUL family heme-binding protein, partial [Holophagaceae bacterium]
MSVKTLLSIILVGANLMATEEPKYKVVEKVGRVEIRQYEPYLVAQTKVNGSFDQAGNLAFRVLFQYISGANKTQTSIAMTAPVAQTKNTGTSIAMTAPVAQTK